MRNVAAFALVILPASVAPAQATGGFWCKAQDQTLTFSVSAAAPRSGGRLLNLKARLQVTDETAPKDLRAFEFKRDDLIQHSLDGREGGSLKLHFHRGGTAKASFEGVRLIIDAPAVDEGKFEGRYALTVERKGPTDPFEASGSVSCSAD